MKFNSHTQETDSKSMLTLPHEFDLLFSVGYEDETIGRYADSNFALLPIENDLIGPARKILRQIENAEIANEVKRILDIVEERLLVFRRLGVNLDHLPCLRAFKVEDGSVLIEWIFDDFRVGFSIETNIDESNWYIVSNQKLGDISASGYISGIELQNLIVWILSFITSYS